MGLTSKKIAMYGYVRQSHTHWKRQRPPKCKAMSQEIVENDLDLQTDPENHLHLAPTSALPVSLTLSPPQ